jgi:hypothetical protein
MLHCGVKVAAAVVATVRVEIDEGGGYHVWFSCYRAHTGCGLSSSNSYIFSLLFDESFVVTDEA